jgi:ankyrin repeat protein
MDQFTAAREGNLQGLRDVLTTHYMNDRDCGWTALHNAAQYGNLGCVKYLIEMRANVNARTISGWTSLHYASHGYVDVVRVLLDAGAMVDGAMVDTIDEDVWTPLYYAIRYDHPEITKLLIDCGAKVDNVKLDDDVPTIPKWITTFIASRSKCRVVSIVVIGIHKYHRTNITGNNDINVLKMIGKYVWSTRMSDVWIR